MSGFESVVERRAVELLVELGWEHRSGPEVEGERGGRLTEVVLGGRLRAAVARLNPHLDAAAVDSVVRTVTTAPTPALEEINRRFHKLLTRGVRLEIDRDGERRGDLARLVDFDRPEANDWLVVDQLSVRGQRGRIRRPDLVLYVNGLPVGVVELKSPTDAEATLEQAWEDLQVYVQDIPVLFETNEVLIVSDGTEALVGALGASFEWFGPWKSIEGETPTPETRSSLETLFRGLLDRGRFLEYLHRFILWDVRDPWIKKIAGYHQFHAVRKAMGATVERHRAAREAAAAPQGGDRKPPDRRIGVVWHTQGSGKSVSMTIYAAWATRHPELENPTLVVITDRTDLDDQLHLQFAAAQDLLGAPDRAESRADLRQKLTGIAGGIVFTTIQKFATAEGETMEPLSERDDVIVVADEAHRSHYEFDDGLAKILREALPNALFLGFTGTPVELADRSTPEVFGDYLDVYPMSQSVADGATVPLHYEARQNRIYALEEVLRRVDDEVRDVVSDLDEEEAARLLREEAGMTRLLADPAVLEHVARDLVEHWEARRQVLEGKGLIATPRRAVAVALHDQIAALRPEWIDPSPDRGRIKVMISSASGKAAHGREGAPPEGTALEDTALEDTALEDTALEDTALEDTALENSALDDDLPEDLFAPHRLDPRGQKTVENRFKAPDDPLELVIVVDKWLTGFDVPPAHTLYLYKPLHGHTLMQAIARVNRKWGDKPSGLIVDYVGVGEDLKQAVGAYGGYPGQRLAAPVEERLAVLQECVEVVRAMLHGVEVEPFYRGDAAARLGTLQAAADHLLGLEDGRERFFDAMARLENAAGVALHLEEARELRDEVGFYQALRRNLAKYTAADGAGGSRLSRREREHRRRVVRQIVQGSIASEGVIDIFDAAGLPRPDVSILSEDFLAAARDSPHPNLQIEVLRKLLEDEIRRRRGRNVIQFRRFSELLQETVNRYRSRSIDAAQMILELTSIAHEMRDARHRGEQLGLSADEVAFYDALADHDGVEKAMGDGTLAAIARRLVETIRDTVSIDWTRKESARAGLRLKVKSLLRREGYPPDRRESAVETVLEQAEALCRDWATNPPQPANDPEPPEDDATSDRPAARIVRNADGVPVVAGAPTKVVELIEHHLGYGETAEEMVESLPHLSLEQIRAALAFYDAHREEIDRDRERRRALAERLRAETADSNRDLVERVRRARERLAGSVEDGDDAGGRG